MSRWNINNVTKTWRDDQYNQQGYVFDHYDSQYMFVKLAADKYIRKYSAVYVNNNGEVSLPNTGITPINAVAICDIDSKDETARYAFVKLRGYNVKVDYVPDSISCVYEGARAAPYGNGAIRTANCAYSLPATVNIFSSTLATLGIGCCATDGGFATFYSLGDIVNVSNDTLTATGSIVKIYNSAAALITAAGAAHVFTGADHLVKVVEFLGTQQKANMTITCANVEYRTISSFDFSTGIVNVSTGTTTLRCNSSIMGTAIKIGDEIIFSGAAVAGVQGAASGGSTRAITAILNAYSATFNVAVNTVINGALGVVANINARHVSVTVGK